MNSKAPQATQGMQLDEDQAVGDDVRYALIQSMLPSEKYDNEIFPCGLLPRCPILFMQDGRVTNWTSLRSKHSHVGPTHDLQGSGR